MRESEYMAIKEPDHIKNREVAQKILKQFYNNYFLSTIEVQPRLSEQGNIENIAEFIEIKKNTHGSSSCSTPVERLFDFAPRAVSIILEAIDEMPGSLAEKEALFMVYVERSKEVEDIEVELLNRAYGNFLKVYDGQALEGPVRRS